VRPTLWVLVAVVFLGACTANTPQEGTTSTSQSPKPSTPVIVETFTHLPCPGQKSAKTTLEIQGCYEQSVLQSDLRINEVTKAIFTALPDDAARRRFVEAAQAWLAYREADCQSAADVNEGGSLARVDFTSCEADLNARRVQKLQGLLKLLQPGR